jgi:hypothetical protein
MTLARWGIDLRAAHLHLRARLVELLARDRCVTAELPAPAQLDAGIVQPRPGLRQLGAGNAEILAQRAHVETRQRLPARHPIPRLEEDLLQFAVELGRHLDGIAGPHHADEARHLARHRLARRPRHRRLSSAP